MLRLRPQIIVLLAVTAVAGCAAMPDMVHEPRVHNPFPQLAKVAVLPFHNLSAEPTVHSDQIAQAYYAELQKIPGFDVMPPGVARKKLEAAGVDLPHQHVRADRPRAPGEPGLFDPRNAEDFQKLARILQVDVVVVGAVTDFSPYYPPRLGLDVSWYAANPGFHEIPAGYGLPWGTEEEEYIPGDLVFESEFALAREQLKTQTPRLGPPPASESSGAEDRPKDSRTASRVKPAAYSKNKGSDLAEVSTAPVDWPDPRGFVPPLPASTRPASIPWTGPVMTHVRLYDGSDAGFTERLANYYYLRDDARFAGYQTYLARSDDFTRFCCHLHLAEMLAARGGADPTRVVWRWPIGRYER